MSSAEATAGALATPVFAVLLECSMVPNSRATRSAETTRLIMVTTMERPVSPGTPW